jgi:hypothetical protein
MKVVAEFDFNGGKDYIQSCYNAELVDIYSVITGIDPYLYKTKVSKEKTMAGELLFAPSKLNSAFKSAFNKAGWEAKKVHCNYIYGNLLENYKAPIQTKSKPFREMDFLKPGKKIGVEVQFGKYAFMVYNVCAKMTIFKNLGVIDCGLEIVPVKRFADQMSTGVSYFEQFAWDLQKRGTSNIDIPVLIYGIDA